MKMIIIFFLSLLLFSLQMEVFAEIKVPATTELTLIPQEIVTSRTATQTLKLNIKDDVLINDVVIFKKGGKAFLKIVDSELASAMRKPGLIEISNGYVFDVNGNKHDVLINKKFYGKEQIWAQVLFSTGLIILPLCLFGFVKGTNAKIGPKNELEVILKEEFMF